MPTTESTSKNLLEQHKKYQYFAMRIERQAYIGKPALALYISDRTNKMHEKLSNMVQREEEQSNR